MYTCVNNTLLRLIAIVSVCNNTALVSYMFSIHMVLGQYCLTVYNISNDIATTVGYWSPVVYPVRYIR